MSDIIIVTYERKEWGTNSPLRLSYDRRLPEGTPHYTLEEEVISGYNRQFWTYKSNFFEANNPAIVPERVMHRPDFIATCWYSRVGSAVVDAGAYTNVFSLGNNRFLNISPIESVSPSGVWSAGSYVSSAAGEVSITALNELPSGETFRHWFVPGVGVWASPVFVVAQNSTIWPIAFYGPHQSEAEEPSNPIIWWQFEEYLKRVILRGPGDPGPYDVLGRLDQLRDSVTVRLGVGKASPKTGYTAEDELESMAQNPEKADSAKLKQGLVEISDKMERLAQLRSKVSEALEKKG